MAVLLSIRPEYAEAIIRRRKLYEFRRRRPKEAKENTLVYIYSTSPVKRVIGAFQIQSIIEDHPKWLWKRFSQHAGIDSNEFFEYFGDLDTGFAIQIGPLKVFTVPVLLDDLAPNMAAPQSFRYVCDSLKVGETDSASPEASPRGPTVTARATRR